MKSFQRLSAIVALTGLLVGAAGCEPEALDAWAGEAAEGADDPAAPAVAADADGLLLMREEEKLARDVYLANAERYGLPVFENIAASEQRHMDAVLGLLDARDLADPAADQPRGVFTADAVQDLFDALDARSARSLDEALRVGAEVEEIDIVDLTRLLAEAEDADLRAVYDSLLSGSYNHLRAYVGQLEGRGVTYAPQHLDAAEYAAILSAGGAGRRGGR